MIDEIPFTETQIYSGDEVSEAVKLWQAGDFERFEFAVKANSIVGKRDGGTERLARDLRVSVDEIERYAAAGALWLAMLRYYPQEAEAWRDGGWIDTKNGKELRGGLYLSFWMLVGAKFKSDIKRIVKAHLAEGNPIDNIESVKADELAQVAKSAKYYMDEAFKGRMTVEEFRNLLPTASVDTTPFTRAVRRIVNIAKKDILKSPASKSGMNDKQFRSFTRTVQWLVKLAEGTVLK